MKLIYTLLILAYVQLYVSSKPSEEETKRLLSELNDILSRDDIKLDSNNDILDSLEKYVKAKKEKLDKEHEDKESKKKEVVEVQVKKEAASVEDAGDDKAFLDKEMGELDAIASSIKHDEEKMSDEEEVLAKVLDDQIKAEKDELEKKDTTTTVLAEENNNVEKKESFHTDEVKETVGDDEGEVECADKYTNYCYKQAVKGACATDAAVMGRYCKRSCRFCCADNADFAKSGRCKIYKKLGMCKRAVDSQDRLRILCPKTCEFCGRAATEALCVRSEFGCCWNGGVAKNHVGTVDDGCKVCKDGYSKTFCNKFAINCNDTWSRAGEQIRRYCPLTCQVCGPHQRCIDNPAMIDSCAQMKYEQNCVNNLNAMKYSCAKTCGLCKHTSIACADTKYGCCNDGVRISQGWFGEGCKECADLIRSDTQHSCAFLKKHHACENNKDRMKSLCPATCGYCKASDNE